jgi:hypothetical protein
LVDGDNAFELLNIIHHGDSGIERMLTPSCYTGKTTISYVAGFHFTATIFCIFGTINNRWLFTG